MDTLPLLHWSAWILASLAALGGIGAVFLRNMVHAIFGLALCLLGLAGLFVQLGFPFIGVMEVLIYIGGISVAMVFAVMLAYNVDLKNPRSPLKLALLGIPCLLLFVALVRLIGDARFLVADSERGDRSVLAVGRALLGPYNVAFESLSIILLLAIIAAILIARKENRS